MTNTTAPAPTHRARKALIPLATLLAASALAIGSGATFTSASNNTISSVTSGTLTHTNSKADQAIFTLGDMKPGDTHTGSLTITNTGSLKAAFRLTEVSSTNQFEHLSLTITDTTNSTPVYSGPFGGLEDGAAEALGTFAPSEARSYDFVVHLDQAAPNSEQGKTASAVYSWDATQLSGAATTE